MCYANKDYDDAAEEVLSIVNKVYPDVRLKGPTIFSFEVEGYPYGILINYDIFDREGAAKTADRVIGSVAHWIEEMSGRGGEVWYR